ARAVQSVSGLAALCSRARLGLYASTLGRAVQRYPPPAPGMRRNAGDIPALAGSPGLRLRPVRALYRPDCSDLAAGLATGDSRRLRRPARPDSDRPSATDGAGPQRATAGADSGGSHAPVRPAGRTPSATQSVHLYILFRLLRRWSGRVVLHPGRAWHPALRWPLSDAALAGRLRRLHLAPNVPRGV